MIGFLTSKVVISTILVWLLTHLVKLFSAYILNNKHFNLKSALHPGGFPSAHTTITVHLFILLALNTNWDTNIISIVALLMALTMYDATNIRLEAGKHAEYLNKKFKTNFKTPLGHTKMEVLGGVILGIISALITYYLPF